MSSKDFYILILLLLFCGLVIALIVTEFETMQAWGHRGAAKNIPLGLQISNVLKNYQFLHDRNDSVKAKVVLF